MTQLAEESLLNGQHVESCKYFAPIGVTWFDLSTSLAVQIYIKLVPGFTFLSFLP